MFVTAGTAQRTVRPGGLTMSSRGLDGDSPARLSDVETLRRLTRDAFAEITTVRDRLRDLEGSLATDRASREGDRLRVATRVEVTAFAPFRADANIDTNKTNTLTAQTTVETPFANGDALVMRLAAVPAGRQAETSHSSNKRTPISAQLDKLSYRVRLGRDAWAKVTFLGGEGHDAAATLNPTSKGASLTGLGAKGAAALSACKGPALCFSKDLNDGFAGFAGGIFRGEGSCDYSEMGSEHSPRALLQVTCRPGTRAAVSIAVSTNVSNGVLSGNAAEVIRSARSLSAADAIISAQGLVAVGESKLIGSWCSHASSDNFHDWGVCATKAPGDDGRPGWGVAVGADGSSFFANSRSPPIRAEAFARLCGARGDGKTVMPGVVVTRCENTKQWDVEVQCKVQIDIES